MSCDNGILVERNGSVVTITIDRPDVLNALDPAAHRALSDAFDAYAADDDLRIAVITGSGGRAFCVGSDLRVRAEMGGDDMPATGFAGLTERFDLFKPVIAAVNGFAMGGGLEIVLACDLAIAVSHAEFGLPEPKVGLAAAGGLHRLARQLPMKHAMEIALGATLFSADRALQFGLVNEVVETGQLAAAVDALVGRLEEGAPLSHQATKQMMQEGLSQPSLKAAFGARYTAYEKMLASEDAKIGSEAFLQKRKPVWTGR